MKRFFGALAPLGLALAGCSSTARPDYVAMAPQPAPLAAVTPRDKLDQRIAEQAKLHHIPASLIHTVVKRESNYNPSLRHGPYWGLMQIRHDTAQSMGYRGPASGLLDADTNMTYAVAYLANAFRIAKGDERKAVRLYAGGYYYEAKRQGLLSQIHPAPGAETAVAQEPTTLQLAAE
jgi:soluble lytic murein transglycosylase-like protein